MRAYAFAEKLENLKMFFKSIRDGKHGDRKQGPISAAVRSAIRNAIHNRLIISIYYHDGVHKTKGWRHVQPYAYGKNKWTGNYVLRAYQLSGPSYSHHEPRWRMFRLDRIFNVATTKLTWNTPVYLFNPTGDRGMSVVIDIIKFDVDFKVGDVVVYRSNPDGKQYTIFEIDEESKKALLIENIDELNRPHEIASLSDLVKVDGNYPNLKNNFPIQ